MTGPQPETQQGVAALGQTLAPSSEAFVSDLADRSTRDIDAYREVLDPRLTRLLRASIEENVIAILHMLEHDIDPDTLDAPPSAIAYARRLAQHDVPLSALLRNYRIGQADFLELAMSLAISTERGAAGPIMKSLVQMVSAYIDNVSEQVTHAYETERDRWVHRHGALLSQRVLDVLQSSATEAPDRQALGYELGQIHLGVVAWLEPSDSEDDSFLDPEELMRQVASALDVAERGLAIPRDDREVWLWLGIDPANVAVSSEALERASLPVAIRVALGSPQVGVTGFRRTHHQAQQVKAAALQARNVPHRVATFSQLGPIAMMGHDMPALRSWVGEVLGPLAGPDDRSSRLRESLRVFLEHRGSYAAAAAELHLHRNTMLYRVRTAKELLGRDLEFDRLNIQLALTAVRWLGSAALPAPAAG